MSWQEDPQSVEIFARDFLPKIQQLTPRLQGFITRPDRSDLGPPIIESCLQVFHAMREMAALLGLVHVTVLATVVTDFLEYLGECRRPWTPQSITLVAETCSFLEQGLFLVGADGTDARIAESTASLTTAIGTAWQEEKAFFAGESRCPELSRWEREAFLHEVEPLLARAEQECVLWDFIAVDLERVADLAHVLHELQQRFAAYGFRDPEQLCDALASTLNRYVHGDFFQTAYPERILLRTIDAVRQAAKEYVPTDDFAMPDVEQLAASIHSMMRRPIGEMLVAAGLVDTSTINRALDLQLSSSAKQPPRLGEVLVSMGAVTPDQVQRLLQEQQRTIVNNESARALSLADPSVNTVFSRGLTSVTDMQRDVRRFDRMGKLIEQLFAMPPVEESRPLLVELQEHCHLCHRAALFSLAERMEQMACEMAAIGNKRLRCSIEGIELLADIGEGWLLSEPLQQLMANAIRHGIEEEEERRRTGKDACGVLRVMITLPATETCVVVEDDGRGIDFARAAATMANVGQGEAAGFAVKSWNQFERLLSQVAAVQAQRPEDGGGKPGLAAVYAFLQQRGGSIRMTSRPGKGTQVVIRLPRHQETL